MLASHLILIGPSGVGKSLIGAHLAQRMGWTLFDVDQDIEEHAGVNIPWIFDKEGEAGFRKREYAALERGLALDNAIIATGAGIVTTPSCYDLIAQPGNQVVFLNASIALLHNRLSKTANRPLLEGGDKQKKIEKMLQAREPLYRKLANLCIDCKGQSPNQLATQILEHAQFDA